MNDYLILVDKISDLPASFQDKGVTSQDYIRNPDAFASKENKVINLCRRYRYLSMGYYCSLFAEARKDRVIPTAKTILSLTHTSLLQPYFESFNVQLERDISEVLFSEKKSKIRFLLVFGRSDNPAFSELGKKIFDRFRCPILSVTIRLEPKPHIDSIKMHSLAKLTPTQLAFFETCFQEYTQKRWSTSRTQLPPKFHLAILENPDDPLPPSNRAALEKFISIGRKLNIGVELIHKNDLFKVPEYDALFIRETTSLTDHTYQFAIKAEAEGMPVIDDPVSILRCANKLYLAEFFAENDIPCPKGVIFGKKGISEVLETLSFPIVLKIPDGNFSRGVTKVDSVEALYDVTESLFKNTDLLIAQEFLYTEYDWRVGILNQTPLFACKYEMSKGHWQTIKRSKTGKISQGNHETLPVEKIPPRVLEIALNATKKIGNGLYGVDIKENDSGIYVIEINDNPSLDAGVEDQVLKDQLYQQILLEFQSRLDRIRGNNSSVG